MGVSELSESPKCSLLVKCILRAMPPSQKLAYLPCAAAECSGWVPGLALEGALEPFRIHLRHWPLLWCGAPRLISTPAFPGRILGSFEGERDGVLVWRKRLPVHEEEEQ